MLKGLVDFQQLYKSDNKELLGAYQQEEVFYLYPSQEVKLKEDPRLAFLLSLFRNETLKMVYGKLNFTTALNFSGLASLDSFREEHPGASISAIPIQPFKLSFHSPSGMASSLTDIIYDSNWYNTTDANFLIYLESAASQILYLTVKDGIVGFSARLDAYIAGISPRLNYNIEFDPHVLIGDLEKSLDQPEGVFPYNDLVNFMGQNFGNLPIAIQPDVPYSDYNAVAQTLLDHLFNRYGQLHAGPSTSNVSFIKLEKPSSGRLILDLAKPVITKRPFTFKFNPFEAAQQIAETDPEAVISLVEAPKIPDQDIIILCNYFIPEGLTEDIYIDLTVRVPKGSLYPTDQEETKHLEANQNMLEYKFSNNNVIKVYDFFYSTRITYYYNGSANTIQGPEINFTSEVFTVLQYSLPCEFISIKADYSLLKDAYLLGSYYYEDKEVSFKLTTDHDTFSYPVLREDAYAMVKAVSIKTSQEVDLPSPIYYSTKLLDANFPTFGPKKAFVKAELPSATDIQTVYFQPEGSEDSTQHVFTKEEPDFTYTWFAPSIFDTHFRYMIEGEEWSPYFNNDESITIK